MARSIKKKPTRRPVKPARARLPERPKRSGMDARMAWAAVSRYPLTTAVTVLVAAVTAAASAVAAGMNSSRWRSR